MSTTMDRQAGALDRRAGRRDLRLVADHGHLVADRGHLAAGRERLVADRGGSVADQRQIIVYPGKPRAEAPRRGPRRRVVVSSSTSVRLTRRGRLVLAVTAILLLAVVSMTLGGLG